MLIVAFSVVFFAGSASAAVKSCDASMPHNERPLLKSKDRGTCVKNAQKNLQLIGYLRAVDVDGRFGPRTVQAVKKFQRDFRLLQDGKIGRTTWAKLVNEVLARRAGTTTKPSGQKIKLPKECLVKGRVFCATKQDNMLRYLVNGRVILTTLVGFGKPGYETVVGVHDVDRKVKNDWSVPFQVPMKNSVYFFRGQAIHWSAAAPGNYSHGCIRVFSKKASERIFMYAQPGDTVVIADENGNVPR